MGSGASGFKLLLAVLLAAALVGSSACAGLRSSSTPSPTTETSPSSSPSTAPTPEEPSPSPAALKITSLPFHSGEVEVSYAPVVMLASGGSPPYDWSISSGFLPAGLALSTTNTISGTPTAAGTWAFTVRLTDSAGKSVSAKKSVTIAKLLTVSPICPTSKPCKVEAGCVTVCGKFGAQTGGIGPFSYKVGGGTLPTKMGLSGLALTGAFPAPATRAGTTTWLFTAIVTDSLGVTTSVSADFLVFSHIAFSASSYTCDSSITTGCSTMLPYTLGTPGLATPTVKVTLISTTPTDLMLPPGYAYSITARSGNVSVNFPATGCGSTQFDHIWVLSLVLVDQSPCSAGANCASAPTKLTVTLLNTC